MFDIVLYEPEIPPNTGNVIRLCAVTGARLHLVGKLGFDLTDKKLRRAGLDYHEFAELAVHDTLTNCLATLPGNRVFPVSTRGEVVYSDVNWQADDALLFGPETRGLPASVLAEYERVIRLPMLAGRRSLNLSNAVAIVTFEAWRQLGFAGAGR